MAQVMDAVSKDIFSLLDRGHGREHIEEELLGKGHDEKFIKEIVIECMKLRYAKRRSQGLVLILGGAVICFLSCVLTLLSPDMHTNVTMVLYGLTSLGILVVFSGFSRIF